MPIPVRTNPETPCQPDGAHHPHRWHCPDPECGGAYRCEFDELICCVCNEYWPCTTNREHAAARAKQRSESG